MHRVLKAGVTEIIPQLQAVQTQQQLHLGQRSARASRLIVWRDHPCQFQLWHHPVHFVQKTIRSGPLRQAAQ